MARSWHAVCSSGSNAVIDLDSGDERMPDPEAESAAGVDAIADEPTTDAAAPAASLAAKGPAEACSTPRHTAGRSASTGTAASPCPGDVPPVSSPTASRQAAVPGVAAQALPATSPRTPAASWAAEVATPSKEELRPYPHGSRTVATEEPPSKRPCCSSSAGAGAAGGAGATEQRAWVRPPPSPLDPMQSLALLLVAVDERTALPPAGFAPPGCSGVMPVLDLYGVTPEGQSVLLHVHGFLPYFYAVRPEGVAIDSCRHALDAVRPSGGVVAAIQEVERTPLMHYREHPEHLLRITVTSQKLLAPCRAALDRGIRLDGGIAWHSAAFEGNVPLGLRFLVDKGISGGGWVEVPGGRFQARGAECRAGTVQLEADAHWNAVLGHRAEGRWLGLAPLRLLALHVRTAGPEGRIVACGAVLQVHGESAPRHRATWLVDAACQGRGGQVPGAEVFTFSNEAACLVDLRDYVIRADADVLIGYDLLNGHLNAVLGRAEASGASKHRCYALGRLPSVASRARNATFETRQLGKHETKDINVEGRLLVDVLSILEREQKLTSYSLSAAALQFLDVTRLELRAVTVEELSRDDPMQLASMALRDAELCLRLFDSLQCLFRYVEMARVTGVPMEYLLERGQSIKVFSMLLRQARAHGYVLPPPARGGAADESYEGGAVFEPLAGFYDEAIVTLDFASLYPSIMQRHNLCYSTLLSRAEPQPPGPSRGPDFEEVPGLGHRFVTASVRRGLIPMVLEELLAARAAAKKEMKLAKDPQTRAVLDGRQLALKVSANSVYGFTGMSVGTLPCQAIAASVTAYGRQMIERTRRVVEARFCREQGYDLDSRVIYGDTDSVMVSLGSGCPLPRAFAFGKEAAEAVSREFGAPVKMEFEKVYMPYLLMNKKRYAGLAWARPEEPGKLDMKGIEVVRRDWCQLVRQVVDRCLHLLLRERSTEQAIAYVQETVASLRQGRVDPRLLVISKALVREGAEAYVAKQAHVELAEKLRLRNPASAPQVGERVPYIFVASAAGTPAYERAEDPLYAMEHGLPIDADYYVEHQLKQPLLRIFEPVLGGEGEASVEQRLFVGEHARRITQGARGSSGPLAAFVRARAKCLGCRALLESDGVLCPSCGAAGRAGDVLLERLSALRPLEAEVTELLSQCMRCEGPGSCRLYAACANVDCPIFFRRLQASQELAATEEALQRLQLGW